MLIVSLDYPPSYNRQYHFARGLPKLTKEAMAYRRHVRQQILKSGAKLLLGNLAVQIELFPPDMRRRDCDNVQKPILDALQAGGAFWDDSQVVFLLTIKRVVVLDGKAIVKIISLANTTIAEAIAVFEGSNTPC